MEAVPRCQNNQDRTDALVKYEVQGHPFNPHDLSGVWGFGGIGTTFMNPPPMTEWGKQKHAATIGEKNAADNTFTLKIPPKAPARRSIVTREDGHA